MSHKSSFDALLDALANLETEKQIQARFMKSVRASQDLGAKFIQGMKGFTKSFSTASNKLKKDRAQLQGERADTLLKSAEAMLTSGNLDAYRMDLLKQKISELKRKQKAKK